MVKIVTIDDDPIVRILVSKALTAKGFDVALAADGFEGINMVLSERPDLILLDIMMPVLDGMEVLRKIRSTPEVAHTPIIMFTAISENEKIKEAARLGANDYIIKPFQTAAVIEKVEQVLRIKTPEAPLPVQPQDTFKLAAIDLLQSNFNLQDLYTVFLFSRRRQILDLFRGRLDTVYNLRVGDPRTDNRLEISYTSPDFIVFDSFHFELSAITTFFSPLLDMRRLQDTKFFLIRSPGLSGMEIEEINKLGMAEVISIPESEGEFSSFIDNCFGVNLVDLSFDGKIAILKRKDTINTDAGEEMHARVLHLLKQGVTRFLIDITILDEITFHELYHLAKVANQPKQLRLEIIFVAGSEEVKKSFRNYIETADATIYPNLGTALDFFKSGKGELPKENGSPGFNPEERITT